jgi:hypothetical protein
MLAKSCAHEQTQKNLVERDLCTSFRHHLHRTTAEWCDVGQVTTDILPDDILIYIFNVYVKGKQKEEWRILVHVCQRWRALVFGSPRHLNLQLFCSIGTRVPTKLKIWPALPIVVCHYDFRGKNVNNLIAAIKHNDRVCKVDFRSLFDRRQVEKIVSVMQVPFPELKKLKLTFDEWSTSAVPVLPDLFLGRSAPRLQHLGLEGFSFPGLPNLLLSTTSLVSLELRRIPHSWYISPDVMVAHLSALTSLKLLTLDFDLHQSRPDREPENRHSSPPTRTLIPALTQLKFEGLNEYAEDLLARIDTPRLDNLDITFYSETVFDISHLSQLISRSAPKFQAPDEVRVTFSDDHITTTLPFPAPGYGRLVLGILCGQSAGQLSYLIQLCRLLMPTFPTVERLYVCQYGNCWRQRWKHGIQHSHWLQLLHLFPDAKDLYISSEITTYIVPVLNKLVGERTGEVLPALENLFFHEYEELSGPTAIEDFIAARELSGHPIGVSRWFAH